MKKKYTKEIIYVTVLRNHTCKDIINNINSLVTLNNFNISN